MKLFVATLQYRDYMPCLVSHIRARQHYEQSGGAIVWAHYAGAKNDSRTLYEMVTARYEELRQLFLQSDCDAFVAIEDDMLIPADTFTRLVNALVYAHVVYGLYVWRGSNATRGWSVYQTLTDSTGISMIDECENEALAAFRAGMVIVSKGLGMGCTAIRRDALEEIPFTLRGDACNDWYFAVDAERHGFTQVTDMGLVCGHMTAKPTWQILYPSDTGNYRRAVYLPMESGA